LHEDIPEAFMDPEHVLANAQEAITVRRVFGEAIQADGVTIVPVATIGGGGGGSKSDKEAGVGFGMHARAAGVFVVRDGEARWRPAVNVNQVIMGGQLVAITAILALRPVLLNWLGSRRHARPDEPRPAL
jgi:uncharacterized spore protein YtfJ